MANKRNRRSGGLNTSYLTKMGLRNLVVNRSMTASSVSVLTVCLLLIGISVLIIANIQNLVTDVEKQNVVVAFVKDDINEAELNKVNTDLLAIENVENVQFVSKEEGFKEQKAEMGIEDDLLNGIIDNPLPHSFRITVINMESFQTTLGAIKAVANVDTVQESQDVVNKITLLQKSVTAICLIMVVVLIIVSLFIITNTIRITMVGRKIDIQVMKSVGATNTFICWPFMIEGIVIGIISGLLALALTYVFQITEGDALNTLFNLFGSSTVTVQDLLPILILGYMLSGIFLGSFGSVVSISKYLKKEGSEANEM